MNTTYRLVWRSSSSEWVVAHENSRSRTRKSARAVVAAGVLATLLCAPAAGAAPPPPAPTALPTGGQVVAGQATIATAVTPTGATMTIQQATSKAVLNWQGFNIGAAAAVNFQQPNAAAVALNRVTGPDPSAIYGSLTANGQVFLVNPNGILFAPGARVDVGGLVASTMDIRNEDFMAGINRFVRNGATGSVVNQGSIVARYAALLAPEVRNEGVVAARMGTVALAAGEAVTLGITGERLVNVQVDKATIDTLVENRNMVKVDAGTVVMSAQSVNALLGRVVNTGEVQANGIVADGGTVRLTASSNIDLGGSISADAGANGRGGTIVAIADLGNAASRTDVTGSLSAKGGTQSGDGGFIETSANKLKVAGTARIGTSAAHGRTGQWLLDPTDFTVAASGGDIDGSTLAGLLGSNNVTIQTGTGSNTSTDRFGTSGTGGDVFVNDTVSWSADTLLTIRAARSIFVNSAITASGSTGSGVALEFGQGLALIDPPPMGGEIVAIRAPINLTANSSFSMKYRSDGIPDIYTVLTTDGALRGITDMSGKYVLGADISTSGSEWTPIGTDVVPFGGQFDGLGHTVSGLHRDQGNESNVGMFASIDFTGMVRNLKLTGVNFAGLNNVGALAGQNSGLVFGVSAAGTVTGQDVQGLNLNNVVAIGGLVGFNQGGILESSSSVNVSAITGDQSTFAATGGSGGIGGLVGVHENFGPGSVLTNVSATGSVTGKGNVGGLVGYANAAIGFAYSTGAVSDNGSGGSVGGLVGAVGPIIGAAPGLFLETYWDTQTSLQSASAGAPGFNESVGKTTLEMKTAATFAMWPTEVWNLADGSYPALRALGSGGGGGGGGGGGVQSVVITLSDINRFYGDPNATITGFSFGTLLAGDSITGVDWGSFSTTTLDAGTYGFSTANLLSPAFSFAPGHSIANYNLSYSANALIVNPRPITVTPDSGQAKVYNGQGGADPALTYALSTTASGSALVGSDSLSGALARAAGRNVGNYAIQQGTLAASSNYQVTFTSGVNFGITQKDSVAWTSATSGNWSNAANWAGGAVPDGNNVLAVSIPAGSFEVTYDASAVPTTLQTLSIAGATLNLGASLSTAGYAQSGGTVAGTGNLTVTNSFAQSAGSIALTGAGTLAITQASNDLTVGSLSAPSITLSALAGAIGQSAPMTTNALTASAHGAIDLNNTANSIGTVNASSNNGNIVIASTRDNLNVTGLSVPLGSADVANHGGSVQFTGAANVGGNLKVLAHSGISQSAPVSVGDILDITALGGDVTLANSSNSFSSVNSVNSGVGDVTLKTSVALTVLAAGIDNQGGNVTLDAGDTLTLNGPVNAGAHSVELLATGAITQTAPIFAGNLNAATFNDSGAAITLDNQGNVVAGVDLRTLNAAGSASVNAAIDFRSTTGFDVGAGGHGIVTLGGVGLISGGAITQSKPILAGSLGVNSVGGLALDRTDNVITTSSGVGSGRFGMGGFFVENTGGGEVRFNNATTTLNVSGVTNSGSGNITISNTGAINVTGSVGADGGDVLITATGALNTAEAVFASGNLGMYALGMNQGGGISAGGVINLHASTGTLAINAPVEASGAQVSLSGGNMSINAVVNNPSGTVVLNNLSGGAVTMGLGQAGFGLSNAELNNIYASNLQFNASPVTVDGAVNLTSIGNLELNATSLTVNNGFTTTGGFSVIAPGTVSVSGASLKAGGMHILAGGVVLVGVGAGIAATNGNLTIILPAGATCVGCDGNLSATGLLNFPRSADSAGSVVTAAATQTIAGVLAQVLAGTNTNSNATLTAAANDVMTLLVAARNTTPVQGSASSTSSVPAGGGSSAAPQKSPQEARGEAVAAMKQVLASACSSCTFSNEAMAAWVGGEFTLPAAKE